MVDSKYHIPEKYYKSRNLATGYWLLVVGFWSLATGQWIG
jgi:hypothetical protein